jgi:hypothetical protein
VIGSIKQIGCPKKMTALNAALACDFGNRFLDLNQIKSPRAQTIVQIVQALRRSNAAVLAVVEQGVKCVATNVGIVTQAIVGANCRFLSNPTQTHSGENL